VAVEIRPAEPSDEDVLAALDRATWTSLTSPAPPPGPDWTFFDERTKPGDVRVALVEGSVAGYVKFGRATPLGASDHVVMITGFAVDHPFRRRGVGRALLAAAIEEAKACQARRVTLRVLGHNEAARRLYESAGFVVEGIARGEFFLGGTYVDDFLMALELRGATAS
jgi:ribosomal protein S18 acetylase RimI-like enzyme